MMVSFELNMNVLVLVKNVLSCVSRGELIVFNKLLVVVMGVRVIVLMWFWCSYLGGVCQNYIRMLVVRNSYVILDLVNMVIVVSNRQMVYSSLFLLMFLVVSLCVFIVMMLIIVVFMLQNIDCIYVSLLKCIQVQFSVIIIRNEGSMNVMLISVVLMMWKCMQLRQMVSCVVNGLGVSWVSVRFFLQFVLVIYCWVFIRLWCMQLVSVIGLLKLSVLSCRKYKMSCCSEYVG